MNLKKEMPDRWVTCPLKLTFVIRDLMEAGERPMKNPDGTLLTYSWRKMIMSAVMTDPRLMEEPLLIDHLERGELIAIARGMPGEIIRVGARALECLQKVLLTSPAFDVQMSMGGTVPTVAVQTMHGYIAQHPEMQDWFALLLDAPSKDPRLANAGSGPTSATDDASKPIAHEVRS